MATLRDIKFRIKGVKNTQQITKAMKMVAAAKLRRAQENMAKAKPYALKIKEVLLNLLSQEKNIVHPLLEVREVKKIGLIVVTSDRGLCGAFNMNVIRFVENLLKNEFSDYVLNKDIEIMLIGKKATDYFKKSENLNIKSYPGVFHDLSFEISSSIVKELIHKFSAKEYDRVMIVYNQFVSVMKQHVAFEQLLPIIPELSEEESKSTVEYIFEPDKKKIIEMLLPKDLNAAFWRILLESYASEQGARMSAMDMATENAKELIRTLTITYNKERQASITTEILEIVSGANALKQG